MRLPPPARLAAYLVLIGLTGCGPTAIDDPPPQLIGVWTTESPTYRDRFLEINRDSVRFGTGQGEARSHEITAVLREKKDAMLTYTLRYQEQGGVESRLHIDYDPTSRALRLEHRPQVIWTRQRDGNQEPGGS